MRHKVPALIVLGLFAGACATVAGLDNEYALDTAQGGGGEGSGGGADAGTDADTPSMCPSAPDDCADEVPEGWMRVGYAPSRGDSCPSGFSEIDVQADPIMDDDTCECDNCQITSPPSCAPSSIPTFIDNGSGQCDIMGILLTNSPAGACNKILASGNGSPVGTHFKGTPPPPTGGACSLTAEPDSTDVEWTEGRLCVPQSASCEAKLCAENGGFAECIQTAGDSDCPPPFSTKHLLGDDAGLFCGACGCTVEGSCAGELEVYTDNNCTLGKLTLPVDGSCVDTNSNATYYRFKYIPEVDSMDCSEEPYAAPGLSPSATLCCK